MILQNPEAGFTGNRRTRNPNCVQKTQVFPTKTPTAWSRWMLRTHDDGAAVEHLNLARAKDKFDGGNLAWETRHRSSTIRATRSPDHEPI